ncbi:MAG: hypothetical protein ACKVP7_13915 [Hyphomicrobiaceae bacterium]
MLWVRVRNFIKHHVGMVGFDTMEVYVAETGTTGETASPIGAGTIPARVEGLTIRLHALGIWAEWQAQLAVGSENRVSNLGHRRKCRKPPAQGQYPIGLVEHSIGMMADQVGNCRHKLIEILSRRKLWWKQFRDLDQQLARRHYDRGWPPVDGRQAVASAVAVGLADGWTL